MSDSDLVTFLTARINEDETTAGAARKLREVAFKRTLLELHLPDEYGCQRCEEPGFACRTLLELAAIYSSHPDYRAEEWKP